MLQSTSGAPLAATAISLLLHLLAVVLVAEGAAAAAADTTIYISNGNKPTRMVIGEGHHKVKFEAREDRFELQSRNGTLLKMAPNVATQSAFTGDIVGIVDIAGNLNVRDVNSADFEVMSADNMLQNWLIAGDADDIFTNGTLGWQTSSGRPLSVQKCGGVYMLGGPHQLNHDEVTKTYTLPPHREVQVTARVNFVDNWDDDVLFMKLDGEYVWTEEYTWCPQFFTLMCARGHNACGKAEYPDRLSRLVQVSLPHTEPTLTVTFGSNIPPEVPPSEVSYGLSSLTVEVR